MFFAKNQWETIYFTLSLQNRRHLGVGGDGLSRLCHVLFLKTRAKKEVVGWRKEVMFDRLLTRSKEYDRDVLKKKRNVNILFTFFKFISQPQFQIGKYGCYQV